ncbi:GbsR/MarR family transcriptional regulator [Maribacter ulvicola]|uniref:DNA-binding transcriptional regulator GbsR, MarR family n=1 Tax=Maribacter ulvicola TaxID=228959 RepID=A0A1N6P4T8_9FLAO|nr:transcriptional regulator [Maribacter ulvicola]SIP99276.1 DNA-binding transcriptional regulator GbsR, MarR family [Maribacter ulvicola]
MNKEESKQVLIEELGVYFETEYDLPPLAARIFANLVVTDEDGLTFEDCLEKRGASKSSISTSLNLLQQIGFINYFTKAGDRKRYFKVSEKDAFFINKLKQSLKKLEAECKIIDKVGEYNALHNPAKYIENKEKKEVYLKCLEQTRDIYKKTINNLKNLHE